MYIKIYEYLNKILSKWQCGFRQGYSAPRRLFVMLERWRQCLDNEGVTGVLLKNLSKAFHCCSLWFRLQMLQSYLSNRKQGTKILMRIVSTAKFWLEFHKAGKMFQISGALLFNIYICDMFHDTNDCDIPSYADDNTLQVAPIQTQ